MMDPIQAVSVVGFPIVAFLLIFYQNNTVIKSNTAAIRELTIFMRGKK